MMQMENGDGYEDGNGDGAAAGMELGTEADPARRRQVHVSRLQSVWRPRQTLCFGDDVDVVLK